MTNIRVGHTCKECKKYIEDHTDSTDEVPSN